MVTAANERTTINHRLQANPTVIAAAVDPNRVIQPQNPVKRVNVVERAAATKINTVIRHHHRNQPKIRRRRRAIVTNRLQVVVHRHRRRRLLRNWKNHHHHHRNMQIHQNQTETRRISNDHRNTQINPKKNPNRKLIHHRCRCIVPYLIRKVMKTMWWHSVALFLKNLKPTKSMKKNRFVLFLTHFRNKFIY